MFEELYSPLPDAAAYLERIGIKNAPPLTPEGLSELVFAHQKTVPFENYELCELNGHINIGIEALYDKVVTRRRGGYCFELNGLFYTLLKALGFDAYPVLAKILQPGNDHPAPLHRCNVVCIDGKRYFTDVGYGGPMPAGCILMEEGVEQQVSNGTYRFNAIEDHNWLISRIDNGQWAPMIKFSDHPSDIVDFISPNFYCSDSPTSFFRLARLANIYRDDGFVSIMNDDFKIVSSEGTVTEKITCKEQELDLLREYFGIVLY